MSKWSNRGMDIDKAILIAEKHPDVDTVDEVYARTSRANTADAPTSKADAWGAE